MLWSSFLWGKRGVENYRMGHSIIGTSSTTTPTGTAAAVLHLANRLFLGALTLILREKFGEARTRTHLCYGRDDEL